MAGIPSSPLSSAPSDTTPPSAMAVLAPRACDDGLPPCSDGDRPPCGHGCKFFLPYPYCGKQNHPANKYWKQFGKPLTVQAILTPSTTLSPTMPSTPTPHYHVTLMSTEYDALCRSRSTDTSSFTILASLLASSMSSTSAHLASSLPLWIIDSGLPFI